MTTAQGAKPIPAMITGNRVSITLDGRFRAFDVNSEQGRRLIEALKEKPQDHDKIREIADITAFLAKHSFGRVVLDDKDNVRLDGKVVNYVAASVFIRILKAGFDMTPITAFIEAVAENPNQDLVNDLYNFCNDNQIAIDDEGYLHMFKRVDDDFRSYHAGREPVTVFYPDGYDPELLPQGEYTSVEGAGGMTTVVTGKIPHPVGGWIEMPRDLCDPSRQSACSVGLHACGFTYLRTYHGGQGKIIHVRMHPSWITAFPYDHEAKLRTSKMEILGVIPESEVEGYFTSAVYRAPEPETPGETAPEPEPIDWSAEGAENGREDGANDRRNGYDYAAFVGERELPADLSGSEDIHAYTTAYVAAYKEGWDSETGDDDDVLISEVLEDWTEQEARDLGEADGYAYADGDTVFDCDPNFGARADEVDGEDPEIVSAYRQGFTLGYTKRFNEQNA